MNIKKIASGIVSASVVMIACVAPAMAAPVTFADFNLRGGAANPFTYTNSGPNSAFTVTGQIPVTFTYQVSSLYGAAGTPINALLSFTAQVNGPVTPAGSLPGDDVSEKVKNVTFTFRPVGLPTANLLTLSNTPVPTALGSTGKIKGTLGDTNVSLRGSTNLGDTVYYTSDYLSFASTVSRGYNFSFSSVNPVLNINQNGFFDGFNTSGTGTFSSDPAPRNPVPEPAPMAAFLIGGMGLALVAFRGRKASRLTA